MKMEGVFINVANYYIICYIIAQYLEIILKLFHAFVQVMNEHGSTPQTAYKNMGKKTSVFVALLWLCIIPSFLIIAAL